MTQIRRMRISARVSGLLFVCLTMAGCRHRSVEAPAPPPPPQEIQPESVPPSSTYAEPTPGSRSRVLYSEVGIASWYGAPYHNARGANGKVYDQDAMTAAHRTLPLGTIVRVTNLATRQSAVVTITDRGPFVPNRMLDLSRAAALKTGVWRPGTARVRMDVLSSPRSIQQGGRWCVQIGVFQHTSSARKLRDQLQRKFPRANVIEFTGSTGYWVRIRPLGESHQASADIAASVRLGEGQAYIVRLD